MTTGVAAPVWGGLVALAAVKMPGGAGQVARVATIGDRPADRAGDRLAVHTGLPVVLVPPGAGGLTITVRLHSSGIGDRAVDLPEKDRADTIISEWLAGVTTAGGTTTAGEPIQDRANLHITATTATTATITMVGNMSAMPSTARLAEAVIMAGTTRAATAGDRHTLRATMGRINWRGWSKTCAMKSPSFIVKSIVCAKNGDPDLEAPGGGRVVFRAALVASAVRGGGLVSGCVTASVKVLIVVDRRRTGVRTGHGMIAAGPKVVPGTGAGPIAPGSIDAVPGARRATAGDLRVDRRMILPGRIAVPMIADRGAPSGAPTTGRNEAV